MKLWFRWLGLVLAFISAFSIVLVPASPSYAAGAAIRGAAVDIFRDPAMLSRLQQSNPSLYARVIAQAGNARVSISAGEWLELRRLGAKPARVGKPQRVSAIAGMEFSSQAAPRVNPKVVVTPKKKYANEIAQLKRFDAYLTTFISGATLVSTFVPVALPFTVPAIAAATFIKLWVGYVTKALELGQEPSTWDQWLLFIFGVIQKPK